MTTAERFHVSVRTPMTADFYVEAEDAEAAESVVKAMFDRGLAEWPLQVKVQTRIGGSTVWWLDAKSSDDYFVEEA